jgi:hypothetical protein
MDFKMHTGGGALAQRLDRAKVSELIDVNRADVTAS